MSIVIRAPQFVLWLILGVGLVAVASVLLKRGKTAMKIVSIAIVAVVCVVILVLLYRPTGLEVTQEALVDRTYFRAVTVPWEEVRGAFVVRDFAGTVWRPVRRVNGTSLPGLKTGWFVLENGDRARVLVQSSPDALVLRTGDTLFLLAPDRFQDLVDAVGRHVTIQTGAEGGG